MPLGKAGYNLPRTLSKKVSKNKEEPSPFQVQGPAISVGEVRRQSEIRALDDRRRNGPERPIFRIGGSVIHERDSTNDAPEHAIAGDSTSSDSRAGTNKVADALPAPASYSFSPDLEKGDKVGDREN